MSFKGNSSSRKSKMCCNLTLNYYATQESIEYLKFFILFKIFHIFFQAQSTLMNLLCCFFSHIAIMPQFISNSCNACLSGRISLNKCINVYSILICITTDYTKKIVYVLDFSKKDTNPLWLMSYQQHLYSYII